MKKLIFVLVSLIFIFAGCSAKAENVMDEVWQSYTSYNLELAVVEQIRNDSLNQIASSLQDGSITAVKFRKRVYQISLIEANTLKFIDSKPEYTNLNYLMWESHSPPKLAWSIPELETDSEAKEAAFEEYLNIYISAHYKSSNDFAERLKSLK